MKKVRAPKLRPCSPTCGYGVSERDGVMTIQCHDMDCDGLRSIGERHGAGFCICGRKLKIRQGFDEHMSLYVTQRWCPKGHEHETVWTADGPQEQ